MMASGIFLSGSASRFGHCFPRKLDSHRPIGLASGALRSAGRLVGPTSGLVGPTCRIVRSTRRLLGLECRFGRSLGQVLSVPGDVHGISGS